MYNDTQTSEKGLSGNAPATPPKSYSFLIRLSRSMGRAATRSYVEVKSILSKEIALPKKHQARDDEVDAKARFGSARVSSSRDEWGRATESPYSSSSGYQNREELLTGRGRHSNQSLQDNSMNEPEKPVAKLGRQEGVRADPSTSLKKAVAQAHEMLASANTVFPLTLFPDTMCVDRTKITIIRRNFFWSSDVMSIRIEDVLNVSASVGPLFGSLTIASRVMSTTDHFKINHFWRSDASHLKCVIQGYVIAQQNNIDTAHLEKDELIDTLKELGHDSGL